MASHRSYSYQPVAVIHQQPRKTSKILRVSEWLPVLATVALTVVILVMIYQLVA